VEEQQKTKEHVIKEEIFDLYNKCLDESAPDRQKLTVQLWEKIRLWNRKYNKWLNHKYYSKLEESTADIFTVEIFAVIKRFIEEEKDKVPKDADGFIRYFVTSLDKEKAKSTRNESPVRLPKEKMANLKKLNEGLKKIKKEKGDDFTESEVLNLVTKYFTMSEYTELMSLKNPTYLELRSLKDDSDEAIFNMLDSTGTSSAFSGSGILREPQDEFEEIQNASIVCEALSNMSDIVESLLKKKQKRTRDRYRALFTAYCLNLTKDYDEVKYFGDLIKVLNKEILETYKTEGKKPTESEIYKKYHSKSFTGTKKSAESMASTMFNKFFDEFSAIFKKKYPEIKLPEC
jgi:hypothetical protein